MQRSVAKGDKTSTLFSTSEEWQQKSELWDTVLAMNQENFYFSAQVKWEIECYVYQADPDLTSQSAPRVASQPRGRQDAKKNPSPQEQRKERSLACLFILKTVAPPPNKQLSNEYQTLTKLNNQSFSLKETR